MVQWLGLCNSTAGGTGSIPAQGSSAARPKTKRNNKKQLDSESILNTNLKNIGLLKENNTLERKGKKT